MDKPFPVQLRDYQTKILQKDGYLTIRGRQFARREHLHYKVRPSVKLSDLIKPRHTRTTVPCDKRDFSFKAGPRILRIALENL